MIVTARHIAEAVLVVVLLVLGFEYVKAREDAIRLKATNDAQNQVIQSINENEEKRNAVLADFMKSQQAQMDANNKRFEQAQSPQAIAALVGQLMGLQKPVTFVTPPATAANPNPQPVAQVPLEDAPQVKTYVQACETCKLNLQTTSKQLSDAQQTHVDDAAKLTAMTKERDSAITAAKGGPWIKRAGKQLKVMTCAGLGAAAGGQKNPTGAAIGAVAGALACSIL